MLVARKGSEPHQISVCVFALDHRGKRPKLPKQHGVGGGARRIGGWKMYNPNTTWLGLLGGGVSGSIIGGGSVYQIDLWHMGGNPLPARVLISGKRLGAVAQLGTGLAALLVTGVRSANELDGLTSSGLDWELSLGLKASAIAKSGTKLFNTLVKKAAGEAANYAFDETAKRFVQWAVGDLGIVKPGKQFNLIPSPVAFGVGAGIFYEWQTMRLLSGNVGWQHISPKWSIEQFNGQVRLQMLDIPEQNGTEVKLGFAVSEFGIDPHIRWAKKAGNGRLGRNKMHIIGYAQDGYIFEESRRMGYAGINLSNFKPIGRSETGMLTVDRTDTVARNATLKLVPQVFDFGNYEYWSASDKLIVKTGSDGSIISAEGNSNLRD